MRHVVDGNERTVNGGELMKLIFFKKPHLRITMQLKLWSLFSPTLILRRLSLPHFNPQKPPQSFIVARE